MGRAEAQRAQDGARRGMAVAGGPRDGQGERREEASVADEARIAGGSEQHVRKRRGRVWRTASG